MPEQYKDRRGHKEYRDHKDYRDLLDRVAQWVQSARLDLRVRKVYREIAARRRLALKSMSD